MDRTRLAIQEWLAAASAQKRTVRAETLGPNRRVAEIDAIAKRRASNVKNAALGVSTVCIERRS